MPVLFTLNGFRLQDANFLQSSSPEMLLNSTSGTFTLTSSSESLYFSLEGRDGNGRVCSHSSVEQFYNFSRLLENGKISFKSNKLIDKA